MEPTLKRDVHHLRVGTKQGIIALVIALAGFIAAGFYFGFF